jgi:asparagine synthase (glutamine-hydrolysing)
MMGYFSPAERRQLWRPAYSSLSELPLTGLEQEFYQASSLSNCSMVQHVDIKSYLPYDILTKVDIASMMHGLEVRTPLVDVRIAELAASIPEKMNIARNSAGQWVGKLLLKQNARRYYPQEFLDRPKKGFSVPVETWFSSNGPLNQEIRERLLQPRVLLNDFFEPDAIQQVVNQNLPRRVWMLLFFEEWLQQNKTRLSW